MKKSIHSRLAKIMAALICAMILLLILPATAHTAVEYSSTLVTEEGGSHDLYLQPGQDFAYLVSSKTMSGLSPNTRYCYYVNLIDRKTTLPASSKPASPATSDSSGNYASTVRVALAASMISKDCEVVACERVATMTSPVTSIIDNQDRSDNPDRIVHVYLVPGLSSSMTTSSGETTVVAGSDDLTIDVTGSCTNLNKGKSYTLSFQLVDKATGQPIEGTSEQTASFTTTASKDAEQTASFTVPSSSLVAGTEIVCRINLLLNGEAVATDAGTADGSPAISVVAPAGDDNPGGGDGQDLNAGGDDDGDKDSGDKDDDNDADKDKDKDKDKADVKDNPKDSDKDKKDSKDSKDSKKKDAKKDSSKSKKDESKSGSAKKSGKDGASSDGSDDDGSGYAGYADGSDEDGDGSGSSSNSKDSKHKKKASGDDGQAKFKEASADGGESYVGSVAGRLVSTGDPRTLLAVMGAAVLAAALMALGRRRKRVRG